jgi:hypothetical protein
LENRPEAKTLEETVKDREDPDGGGVEGPACGPGHPVGPEPWRSPPASSWRFAVQERFPDASWCRWLCRPSGARPSAIDRGERETVKGREILKETHVDQLDVNRVPPDLCQGMDRKSSSDRGGAEPGHCLVVRLGQEWDVGRWPGPAGVGTVWTLSPARRWSLNQTCDQTGPSSGNSQTSD